jgi:hypothetical protein
MVLKDISSHGSFENDGLKKVKLEFLEHDVLEMEEIQDDLESHILKACCDKVNAITVDEKLERM